MEEHKQLIDDVCKAKKQVLELADCKPDIQKAKDELAAVQAKEGAGETEELIDEECKAKKNILEKEKCLPKLEKAETDLKEAQEKLDAHGITLLAQGNVTKKC